MRSTIASGNKEKCWGYRKMVCKICAAKARCIGPEILWEIGGAVAVCLRFVNSISGLVQAFDKKRGLFRSKKCGTFQRRENAGSKHRKICEQHKILRQLKAWIS
jgi:hypothetical protein